LAGDDDIGNNCGGGVDDYDHDYHRNSAFPALIFILWQSDQARWRLCSDYVFGCEVQRGK
jgi:hypothetical protein